MRPSWARALHRALDRIDARYWRALRATGASERAWVAILDAVVAQQADRVYFRRHIVPAIAHQAPARILFVGVRGYTRGTLRQLAQSGAEVWTSDIDPSAAPHGVRGRHVTCDIADVDRQFAPGFFDLAIVNGVFGWGCDEPAAIARALDALHRVLSPNGILLLGWNSDRIADPPTIASRADVFAATSFGALPARKTFTDVTHVYGWYRRV